MATVNIGNKNVLVIKISHGGIDSVCNEYRSVYENSKGKFIKTQNDGQIFIDERNVAIIATRRERTKNGYLVTRYYKPAQTEIETMLHQMFSAYALEEFIK